MGRNRYMTCVSIIAAMGHNRKLGKRGAAQLLWHIPEDFKHFKALTMGKPVIMGSKTYESIGKPLPGRQNVVLSEDGAYEAPGCEVATSLPAALECAGEGEVFIIGGAYVYEQALPLADRLYVTIIDAEFPEADIFFPEYPGFHVVDTRDSQDEHFTYKFVTLERNEHPRDN